MTPTRWYRPRIASGLIWVAAEGDTPIGFASTEVFDGALHLWELAVRLEVQKQGVGRALVTAVVADARARSLPAVTLTTFRDIAWNGPFYARLGFVDVPWAQAGARLADLEAHEAGLGLDMASRCAMRLAL